jgi:antitoxin (DNA-binding transcriptional repressor) of toxin-antitoxin stability system
VRVFRSGKAIARIVPIKATAQSWQRDSAPLDIKGLALSREVLKDRANSA